MWRQDIRYALRTMRRAPGFTTVAALSLALGIGANTAIFSLINTVMLRRLPAHQPERLVELLHRFPGEPRFNGYSWQSYRFFLDRNHVFSGLIATTGAPSPRGSAFQVRFEGDETRAVDGAFVTGSFFPVLGVKPALGRLFGPEDDRLDAPSGVAVISWSLWKNRYQFDRSIIGKRIVVEGVSVAIAGVAARGFPGLRIDFSEDIWLPLAFQTILSPSRNYTQSGGGLTLTGRLKPGVSIEQAHAEMAVLYRRTVEDDKTGGSRFQRVMTFELAPAGGGLTRVRDEFGNPLLVLMAAVGLLLLIACTNIASLMLARAAARQREMALRVSLGATGWRLVRQMLTEALLLSAAGTALGILFAYAGASVLLRIISSGRYPVVLHVQPDARVLLFTAGLAVLTGILFGLAPALRAYRTAPASSLREAGRAGETRRRRLFGKALVAAQVALSLVLLTAAGLFAGHLAKLYSDLGFQRDHVLLVILNPAGSGYRREQLAQPYRELLARLQSIPQVRSATFSAVTPIQGAGANRDATVEGYQAKPGELRYIAENWVAPRYFETLGMSLLMGRDFTFSDEGRPRVAIINQTTMRHFFGRANPLGKHVLFDGDTKPYEIVGVVSDGKYLDANEKTPRTIFFNTFQENRIYSQFVIRTTGPPAAVAGEVQQAVKQVLKTIRVDRITTLADQVDAAIVPERLIVMLSGVFGVLGAVLAAIGIFGLLAYTVTRRINEIGIRMALGATRGDVTGMVLRDALAMVSGGLLAGVPLALAGQRLAVSLIQDLRGTVVTPLAFAAAAMIAVALLSAWVPARRAARLDPMDALRHE